MSTEHSIINILNDLKFHEGTEIGASINKSRAAVWKAIQKLKERGIEIITERNKGYCLAHEVYLLDADTIQSKIDDKAATIVVLNKVKSTNTYLAENKSSHKTFCVAEQQSEGRGRLKKAWSSPFASNIYLSLKYNFHKDISELGGLSLAIAVSVAKAIEQECKLADPIQLKWPNDLYIKHKKLAGILIDIKAEPHACTQAIIGIGVNINMKNNPDITQNWTSIAENSGNQDRNNICAALCNQLLQDIELFNNQGLHAFLQDWNARDYLRKQHINLKAHGEKISGVCSGIDDHGRLCIVDSNKLKQCYTSGEAERVRIDSE